MQINLRPLCGIRYFSRPLCCKMTRADKTMHSVRLLLFSCLAFASPTFAQKKVVVLGSSTAAGSGASSYANAWVSKYTAYLQSVNPANTLVNLAVGGYNTYLIIPTGTPHGGRPDQDPARNVTAAVATYHADVVIVNMPTNDVANSYDVSETLLNYRRIKAYCDSAHVTLYIATSQPRNFTDAGKLGQLMQIRDSTVAQYGSYAIDFWNTLANADGTIQPAYNSGDGVHLNDAGHDLLFQRVKAKPVLGATALPVFFRSLSVAMLNSGVKLDWQLSGGTAEEQEVQRAVDGFSFVPIGRVPSSTKESFSFVDPQPLAGVNYYRIKAGKNAPVYSAIVRFSNGDSKTGLLVSPNPVADGQLRLQVERTAATSGQLLLLDASGREILRQYLPVQKGTTAINLQVPLFTQKGIYFIRFTTEQGDVSRVPVVIN